MADYFIENKDKINTVLESGTHLEGNLHFKTSLKIKGKFKGVIRSEGLLVIAPEAEVEAEIFSHDVVVAGTVKGNITSLNKLEIEETGKLYGDIKTYKLKIADGVYFDGNCEMLSREELEGLMSETPVNEKNAKKK
jgi:cytoskeletal protein CcmA (bactofilin family)